MVARARSGVQKATEIRAYAHLQTTLSRSLSRKGYGLMFLGKARWFLVAGLASTALACSSDPTPDDGTGGMAGSAGTPSGGGGNSSTAGATSGGGGNSSTAGATSGGGGNSSTAGATSGGAGAGGKATGGTGGSAAGAGGQAAGGGGAGGAGGAGGGGSGGGGASSMPTAVADIMGLNGQAVMGTATFTQGATMTKLVINLTACPNGKHSSHLHMTKDCGNNGTAAGSHWVPNGENFGDYTCTDTKGMHMLERPLSQWTVGDGKDTDVTKYSFLVHAQGDDQGSGDRIGCGLVNLK
jgi:hypothetical protein